MYSWRDEITGLRTSIVSSAPLRSAVAGLLAVVIGGVVLQYFPSVELAIFGRAAAELAGMFTGHPVLRVNEGWMLASKERLVVVTTACSASHYCLLVAFLVSTHLRARGRALLFSGATGLLLAVPVSVLINSIRVVVITQVHRWIIPRFPENYGPFLHLLAGVAIFLPALIGLNLFLETYARRSPSARG